MDKFLEGAGGQEVLELPRTLTLFDLPCFPLERRGKSLFGTFRGPYVRLICVSHEVL